LENVFFIVDIFGVERESAGWEFFCCFIFCGREGKPLKEFKSTLAKIQIQNDR
jgi:hypothetical protein